MSDASHFVSGACAHTYLWVNVSVSGPLCICVSVPVCVLRACCFESSVYAFLGSVPRVSVPLGVI